MGVLPKNTAKGGGEEALGAGSVIVYEHQGQPILGLVLEFRKQKYVVRNEFGSELELAAVRLHQLPGRMESRSQKADAEALGAMHRKAAEQAAAFPIQELWSFVVDDQHEYSNAELCALYYGENKQFEHFVLRLALLADNVYFKRKKEFFIPRPAEIVDELKKAEETRVHKQRQQELALQGFRERLQNPQAPLPPEAEHNIVLLEELAAATPEVDNARLKEARQLLVLCSEQLDVELVGPREEQAYRLLRAIHHFDENTNLAQIRHHVRVEFPEEALREAAALVVPERLEEYADAATRKDLTGVDTITIDDATTRDMDDAISIEQTESGYRLGVHISDVAALVPHGSALDLEARLRTTSLYFPNGTISMFPPQISAEKCSLIEGAVRPCLSCIFELDGEFAVQRAEVVPSLIKVRRRMSYEQVDDLLEHGDHDLGLLYQIGSALEERRFAQGGFKVNRKDIQVVCEPDGRLTLREIDENAPSRAMIGEMMILANETIADYAARHDIAILFRGQVPPDEDQHRAHGVPEGLAHDYAMRAGLKPTAVSFDPAPHHTLGIAAYTQATSPIRRYVDLCNQRQILWYLRDGKPLFTREEYEAIVVETDAARATAGAVTKETKRFWFLRYLEQRARENPIIEATVLRSDRKLPLIELHEVHMPTIVKLPFDVKPGDELRLRITRANPAFDELRLEPAGRG